MAIKESDAETGLIISFHPAEFKLCYAFRNEPL
jgi:hypothetical protein